MRKADPEKYRFARNRVATVEWSKALLWRGNKRKPKRSPGSLSLGLDNLSNFLLGIVIGAVGSKYLRVL